MSHPVPQPIHLTTLPQLPPPEQNLQTLVERLNSTQRPMTASNLQHLHETASSLERTIRGSQGWSARLFQAQPGAASIHNCTLYALHPLLAPLADWWQLAVQEAVTNCPKPDNVTLQRRTPEGRNRLLNTIQRAFSISAEIETAADRWFSLRVQSVLAFDGNTKRARDITWPFHQGLVTNLLVEALEDALGAHTIMGTQTHPAYRRIRTTGEQQNRHSRFFHELQPAPRT